MPGGRASLDRLVGRNSTQWLREYADLAALAQHHRLPTRLLDFTRRAYVAAYFAAIETPDPPADRMAVWALNEGFLRYGESTDGAWYALIRAARASNPNLHAQSGVFVTWAGPEEVLPLEVLVARVGRGEIPLCPGTSFGSTLPVLTKMELPRSLAPELLRVLALEGVTGASLFPGCDGIVGELKERRLRVPAKASGGSS